MKTSRYTFSPWCVVVPSADPSSMLIVHALHGSRFIVTTDLVKALIGPESPPPPAAHRQKWNAAVKALIREQVLIDRRTRQRMAHPKTPVNHLDPIALAMLRAFNEGGTKRTFVGPEPPARKRIPAGRRIALASHDAGRCDTTLVDCLATRRSVRTYSKRPLDRGALELFLQLTARVSYRTNESDITGTSRRNYPSGGARYPLEIYPVVLNVRSLARGFYYYDAFQHRLVFLGGKPRYVEALRRTARINMGRPASDSSEPAVLFLITAVFPRVSWKYEGIPLHLVLQETGALYQTMYLVAAMMNLAPCAIGAFPERAVEEILGLDALVESQVGMMALGVTTGRAATPA